MDSPAGYSSLKMPNVCLLGRRWIILWLLSDLLLGGSAFSPVLSRLQRSHSSLFTSLLDIQDERLEQIGRATFQSHFSFPLDDWQCRAGGAISEGSNVIVCAPTGAGKTVIGEMALIHAHQLKKKGIYTTPLKALSNQKYTELITRFDDVGLSTGDISINKGAAMTVMTTEVYRNQASRFGSSTNYDASLEDTAVVVLDEFHYMGLPGRGSVWEESVITSPDFVQLIALSATLSNAKQLADWLKQVSQRPTILVQVPDYQRPVPLRYLFATRDGLYPLFQDPDAGPGAPHGLLGWGSSEQEPDENIDKRAGFGSSNKKSNQKKAKKLPRGLQINSALKAAAEKRMQRVNRALERSKFEVAIGARDNRRRYDSQNEFFDRRKGLQTRKLTVKEEQKEKERLLKKELRRSVPSLSALVQRLDQKQLLPAIFFLFSRAGCDEAARGVCQSMRGPRDFMDSAVDDIKREQRRSPRRRSPGLVEDYSGRVFRSGSNFVDEDFVTAIYESEVRDMTDEKAYAESSPLSPKSFNFFVKAGLLNLDQVEEVANRIAYFNDKNPEIAFEEDVIEQFLFGVGSHHAGHLPAHKSFVESLFQKQLMKVVFATETLAAGINMPARTTVICALAKRGDGSSMNLLETSNLLQMAGRAGRRGMDTSGTCVIVATPFESESDAGKILIDEIKPIRSQFTPSYTLAVNLIARGEGQLGVAKMLIQKSFAMWQKGEVDEKSPNPDEDIILEETDDFIQAKFIVSLIDFLQDHINKRSVKYDTARFEPLIEMLTDQERLKKSSKSYQGIQSMIELERATLNYLQNELAEITSASNDSGERFLGDLVDEERKDLLNHIARQEDRINLSTKDLKKHPFTKLTKLVNEILADETSETLVLKESLLQAKRKLPDSDTIDCVLTGSELSSFSKSFIKILRKKRKQMSRTQGASEATTKAEESPSMNDSWSDMLAITRTLVAYGCLASDPPLAGDSDLESCHFSLTGAGTSVAMLGFENSLWCLVAMGGAWDVLGTSSEFDDATSKWNLIDEPEEWSEPIGNPGNPFLSSQKEAEDLTDRLCSMSASEIAGYVSCLVSDDARGDSSVALVDRFQRLTKKQQKAIQSSLMSLERLLAVQQSFCVDEKPRRCPFDISNCEVVTEWAAGCSWNEALAIADVPPGDLVRTLSRAMDGLRQLGNLPYMPIRRSDLMDGSGVQKFPSGLHPEVRKLCRDAAKAINRYPVKDFLAFEAEGQDDITEELEDWEGEGAEETEQPDPSL